MPGAKRDLSGRVEMRGKVRRGADKAVHGIDRVGPGRESGWCSYTERSLRQRAVQRAVQRERECSSSEGWVAWECITPDHRNPGSGKGGRKSSSSHHPSLVASQMRCFFSLVSVSRGRRLRMRRDTTSASRPPRAGHREQAVSSYLASREQLHSKPRAAT